MKSASVLKLDENVRKLIAANHYIKSSPRPKASVVRNLREMNSSASFRALNIVQELYNSNKISRRELRQLRGRILQTSTETEDLLGGRRQGTGKGWVKLLHGWR